MSFILDALRKSETERQRQSGPGIADAGYRPPAPRRPLWMPVLVAVLVANMLLLAAFWWRGQTRTPASAAAAPEPAVVSAPLPRVVSPASAARAAGAEDAVPEPGGESAAAPAGSDGRTEILEPPGGSLPAAATVTGGGGSSLAPDASPRQSADGGLPTADQMVAAGVLNGPPLHMDLHVFSTRIPERFVFINTRKYTEGAELPGGIRVEQITPDGVVLSKNGSRFMLSTE
jgi:general secretion pathway protein B